jgi:hypothetical protein
VLRGGDGKNNIQPMGTPDAGTLKLLEDAGVKLPSEEDIKKMNDWFFQTDPGGPKKTTYGSLTITGSATFYEGMTEAQLKVENFKIYIR